MNWNLGSLFLRSYILLLLVTGFLMGSSPQIWFIVPLIIVFSFNLYKPARPQTDFLITLIAFTVVPLVWSSFLHPILSVLVVIPALITLDNELRSLHPTIQIPSFRPGYRSSHVLNSLVALVICLAVVGVLAGSLALVALTTILFTAILTRILQVAIQLTKIPIEGTSEELRVIAMKEVSMSLTLQNHSPFQLLVKATSPYAWLKISSEPFEIQPRGAITIEIIVKPPLSGPTRPTIQLTIKNPWGLIWTGQNLKPFEINVIPRAKYAEWLGKRYLEQNGPIGDITIGTQLLGLTRGVEYNSSRVYQPGDRQKDIDWHHSLKFQELIIREYKDPALGRIILLVNLESANYDESDWVAYYMMTSALTAARQGLPVALAAYNQENVISWPKLLNGKEAIKTTLQLLQRIAIRSQEERFLDTPNPVRLRRELDAQNYKDNQTKITNIHELMRIELDALENYSRDHPVSQVLHKHLTKIPPPATITIISRWNHDAEVLSVVIPRLRYKGYTVLDLKAESR